MKKLKLNLFMVVAVAIAAVTMSFKMAEKSHLQDEHWFLMNSAGTALTNTQVDDPDALCPTALTPNCARAYDISQTEPAPGGGIRVKSSEIANYSDFRGKP